MALQISLEYKCSKEITKTFLYLSEHAGSLNKDMIAICQKDRLKNLESSTTSTDN